MCGLLPGSIHGQEVPTLPTMAIQFDLLRLLWARRGDLSAVEACLQSGANVNYRGHINAFGRMPLYYAVCYGDAKMIRTLSKHGADMNATYFCEEDECGV